MAHPCKNKNRLIFKKQEDNEYTYNSITYNNRNDMQHFIFYYTNILHGAS